jgi:hypothetical protein
VKLIYILKSDMVFRLNVYKKDQFLLTPLLNNLPALLSMKGYAGINKLDPATGQWLHPALVLLQANFAQKSNTIEEIHLNIS